MVGDNEGDALSVGMDAAAGEDVPVGIGSAGDGVTDEPGLRIGGDGTTDALHASSARTSRVPAVMSVNRIRSPLRRHLDGYADAPDPSLVTARPRVRTQGTPRSAGVMGLDVTREVDVV
jgi:hypothetical protein